MAEREIKGKSKAFLQSEEFTFDTVGDTLEGKLLEKATLISKKSGKPFRKYTVGASDGNYSFLGNNDLDGKLPDLEDETVVRIKLVKLAPNPHGGNPMKIFKVSEITPD